MRARVIFVLLKRTLLEKAKNFLLERFCGNSVEARAKATVREGTQRVAISFGEYLEKLYVHPPVCGGEQIVFRIGADY